MSGGKTHPVIQAVCKRSGRVAEPGAGRAGKLPGRMVRTSLTASGGEWPTDVGMNFPVLRIDTGVHRPERRRLTIADLQPGTPRLHRFARVDVLPQTR